MINPKPVVLAVANTKGGVGKTTVARELASCFALRGFQTLVIDCDPQASLTGSLVEPEIVAHYLSEVLIPAAQAGGGRPATRPISIAVIETAIPNLDLVAADEALKGFDKESHESLYILRREISQRCGGYDIVVLDCPPFFGNMQTATMYAANYVVVPCSSTAMGVDGLVSLGEKIRSIQDSFNPGLKVLGIVINLFKPQRQLAAVVRAEVVRAADENGLTRVFATNIHDYTEIAEAPTEKLPVVLYAPRQPAAKQMWALTDEVLTGVGLPANAPGASAEGLEHEEELKSPTANAQAQAGGAGPAVVAG